MGEVLMRLVWIRRIVVMLLQVMRRRMRTLLAREQRIFERRYRLQIRPKPSSVYRAFWTRKPWWRLVDVKTSILCFCV